MSQTNTPAPDLGDLFKAASQATKAAKVAAEATGASRPPESLLLLAGSLLGFSLGAAQVAPASVSPWLMVGSAIIAGLTSLGRH
jgi:hypothetical protein